MRGKFAGRTGLKTQGLTGRITGFFGLGDVSETLLRGKQWPDSYPQPTQPASTTTIGVFLHSPGHTRPSGPVFVNAGELT
jgi:hypothetical protein